MFIYLQTNSVWSGLRWILNGSPVHDFPWTWIGPSNIEGKFSSNFLPNWAVWKFSPNSQLSFVTRQVLMVVRVNTWVHPDVKPTSTSFSHAASQGNVKHFEEKCYLPPSAYVSLDMCTKVIQMSGERACAVPSNQRVQPIVLSRLLAMDGCVIVAMQTRNVLIRESRGNSYRHRQYPEFRIEPGNLELWGSIHQKLLLA